MLIVAILLRLSVTGFIGGMIYTSATLGHYGQLLVWVASAAIFITFGDAPESSGDLVAEDRRGRVLR